MLLVTIDQFKEAISAPDNSDVDALVGLALKQVTAGLASILRMPGFDFNSYTEAVPSVVIPFVDYFVIPVDIQQFTADPIPLQLRRGFLTSTAPIIKIAATIDGLEDEDANTDTRIVNSEKGVIHLFSTLSQASVLSVTYEAGFEVIEGTDPATYDGVPAWLQAIAIAYGLEIYSRLKTWSTDSPKPIGPPSSAVMTMITPYLRGGSEFLRSTYD